MDYIVKFIGHIVESKRPYGFPSVIENSMIVRVNTIEELRIHTDAQMRAFIEFQGMSVPKNQNKHIVHAEPGEATEEILDTRIFVPFSSIAYISTETKRLTNPMMELSEALVQ